MLFIEVVKVFQFDRQAWILKTTANGLTYLWTGYGWTLGNSIPKPFESEDAAKEELISASNHATGV